MTKWCNTCDHKAYCRGGNDTYTMGCSRYIKAKPMTNEEYLRSCTTEQLAEFLADKYNEAVDWILYEVDEHAGNIEPDDYWYRQDVVAEWLKQPHNS